jgi:hypothetical protein
MSDVKKKTTTKPVKMIRHGAVAASIWKRQAPSGFEYYDFSLSRSWKTQSTGREGYSPNFFAANADDLQATIADATSWIASQQASMLAGERSGQAEPVGSGKNGSTYSAF